MVGRWMLNPVREEKSEIGRIKRLTTTSSCIFIPQGYECNEYACKVSCLLLVGKLMALTNSCAGNEESCSWETLVHCYKLSSFYTNCKTWEKSAIPVLDKKFLHEHFMFWNHRKGFVVVVWLIPVIILHLNDTWGKRHQSMQKHSCEKSAHWASCTDI